MTVFRKMLFGDLRVKFFFEHRMQRLFLFLTILVAPAAFAQQLTWYVFAHDDGCLNLGVLNRRGKLPRAPVSPEDYAQMMRDQGKTVVVEEMPAGFSADLAGKLVQVKIGDAEAVIFVREEVCRNMGR